MRARARNWARVRSHGAACACALMQPARLSVYEAAKLETSRSLQTSDGSRHQNCRRVDHVAKIYVIRGSSVENFISANLKIQSAEY